MKEPYRKFLKEKGYSINKLANAIGMSHGGVENALSNDIGRWRVDMLARIAKEFNLSIEEFYLMFRDK